MNLRFTTKNESKPEVQVLRFNNEPREPRGLT